MRGVDGFDSRYSIFSGGAVDIEVFLKSKLVVLLNSNVQVQMGCMQTYQEVD